MLRNPKHETFAREIAANEPVFGEKGPALLAAMVKAGYVASLPNGRKLRNMREIADRVMQLRKAHADFVCADIGRIVQEQASIAYADIVDYYDWSDRGEPTLKDLSKLPRTLTCAIRKLKFDKNGNAHIELHDKPGALAAVQSYRDQVPGDNAGRKANKEPDQPPAAAFSEHSDWAGLVAGDRPTSH